MSMIFGLVLAASSTATAPTPPPGLQFGFWRMAAFKQQAKDMRCQVGDMNAELEKLRKQLEKKYGKESFAWPKTQPTPPGLGGDCSTITMVYRANLDSFRKEANADLHKLEVP